MPNRKRINLALQGGGAHGAFTWGALDRLLEDDRIEIAGISGTSAGALNGSALKSGMVQGGREGARENLEWLWMKIAGLHDLRLAGWMQPFGGAGVVAQALELSPVYQWGEALSRVISPYVYGPFYTNPLQKIVDEFDFARVCADEGPDFFVSATKVRTGKLRVFQGDEINTSVILASACLPTLFQAVEIDDSTSGRREIFWDGGYTGNPALFPLFAKHLPADLVIININPLERDDLPVTPQQIQNRINEISFNSSLLRELRAINFVQRLLNEHRIEEGTMARVYVHMISDDDLMNKLSVATKLVPNAFVIRQLKEAGRAATDAWLATHFDDLDRQSTVDMAQMYS